MSTLKCRHIMISISDYNIEMLVYILLITYFMWICGMSSFRFMLELAFDIVEMSLTKIWEIVKYL